MGWPTAIRISSATPWGPGLHCRGLGHACEAQASRVHTVRLVSSPIPPNDVPVSLTPLRRLDPGVTERPQLDGLERGWVAQEFALAVPDHEPTVEPHVELDPLPGAAASVRRDAMTHSPPPWPPGLRRATGEPGPRVRKGGCHVCVAMVDDGHGHRCTARWNGRRGAGTGRVRGRLGRAGPRRHHHHQMSESSATAATRPHRTG